MTTIEKKSLKAGKYVNTGHVDIIIRNYKQERWIQNSRQLGKEDSLSVWYSVEELEEFLETVKSYGGDGIKLYFGAYSHDYTDNPVYAGRQTIVLVATKVKESMNGDVNKDLYITTQHGTSILAYNVGRLCPPWCGGNGLDETELGITILDKGNDGMVVV